MNQAVVRSYVPGDFFLLEKNERSCRECKEDFAVIFPEKEHSILASRGSSFTVGTSLFDTFSVTKEDRLFYEERLLGKETFYLASQNRLLCVFPQLFRETGLLFMILPNGVAENLRDALLRLPFVNENQLSPSLQNLSAHGFPKKEDCLMLAEQNAGMESIFSVKTDDFRLHGAKIAEFCGCRTNLVSLPTGALPIPKSSFCTLSAFLVCLFLSLRGSDKQGPLFSVKEVTHGEISLSAFQNLPQKSALSFPFLHLPCFSNISLFHDKNAFSLEIRLPRSRMLRALANVEVIRIVFEG